MNKLDKQYTALLQDILDNGVTKQDRTGTGTLSVFGRQIRHKMSEGFPLLTTKKMPFKTITTELLWFLRGDTNIKYLVDNNCHIWDGDAYKFFKNSFPIKKSNPSKDYINENGQLLSQEEFINKIKTDSDFCGVYGNLGPVYGKQWRQWTKFQQYEGEKTIDTYQIDQIANLINDIKTNPDSRRLMVTAWNPADLDASVLPPCHYGFQTYTRELSLEERVQYLFYKTDLSKIYLIQPTEEQLNKENIPTRTISLMWNQRSVDTFLGLPFNIASYGLLLQIIAKEVNMVPDELIGNLGDTHLYLNHIEQAKEQIGRELTIEERHQLALPIWKEKYGPLADMMVMTNVDNTPYKIPKRSREPYPLPTLVMVTNPDLKFDEYVLDNFKLVNYQSHPTIKAPLSN